jgi:LEA14-like dessication related protein
MQNKEALCEKIRAIYPDIGSCGIDVDVDFNEEKKAWVVHLQKGEHELETYLEPQDADRCMEGKESVHLGLQVEQLKENIKS